MSDYEPLEDVLEAWARMEQGELVDWDGVRLRLTSHLDQLRSHTADDGDAIVVLWPVEALLEGVELVLAGHREAASARIGSHGQEALRALEELRRRRGPSI